MKLMIMRHGEAGAHAVDAQRCLTSRGQAECQRVAGQMAKSSWKPAAVWSSPLVRAQQTANIVAAGFGLDIKSFGSLVPESDPLALIETLQQYASAEPLLLVSHMPLVGELFAILVDGRGSYGFSTSQVVCLEMDIAAAGCGEFRHRFLP
ncbi:phosphohistidine phosphatase SixA [Hydrocarboniclastica marina]|uniref:Phosphohistidine phosphatase SixA n=1 Tax=Hydrocarboniclastica marina TaxID=2259620 RepID=A0A4P7XJN8_9ALTE|nr:phosphohistidine phosphatase SixA [Hydrocarboniclastica marina]MAL99346.1 phosphohistidine phosphatase SixA [Alteromonadaceae bacterium]QCF26087.1 phosphohistidine phosphatase SixA [Hydrocarboniclastica marina]|tara:strand:+ start:4403 stop:4852 length:450 start_codon:yes stop_codon:yes gene_type:complete